MSGKSGPNGTKPDQIGPDEFAESIERGQNETPNRLLAPINDDDATDENAVERANVGDLEEVDDLRITLALLTGFNVHSSKGLPKKQYLKANEELVARKALARLLRNQKPLDQAIRSRLAALFDPETETAPFCSFDLAPIERQLTFKTRHRGARTTAAMSRLEIAIAFNRLQAKSSRKDALEEIAKRFAISTRTVEAAIAYHRSLVNR
jgi:hypothetical protein